MKGTLQRLLPVGGFARNVTTLTGATAFSQLVVLAALPILTRLYAPGEYGAAAVYAGIVGLIGVTATLRYEFAVPLPRSDRSALHVAAIALTALIVVALASGLASPWLHLWLGENSGLSSGLFSFLIVVGILSAGVYQVANYWAVRKSNFRAIARTRIQQGMAGTGSQLVLGFAGFGALGLIVGQIIGQCAGVARLAGGMISDNRKSGSRVRRHGLAWAAKRYKKFPLYDSSAGLLNVAGGQAPVLLFAVLFSPALAGFYALAYRILSAPLGLVGKSISQVLLPRIVEANRHGETGPLMLRLLGILATISLFPFAVVTVVAADIVPILFSAEWTSAASVVAWTAFWAGWQFICSPLSVVLIGIEAQRLNTALQAMLLVLRVSALLAGAVHDSPEFALVAFSIASAIGYVCYTLATGLAMKLPLRRMIAAIWQPALLAGTCWVAVVGIPEGMGGIRYGTVAFLAGVWLWCLWKLFRSSISNPDRTPSSASR